MELLQCYIAIFFIFWIGYSIGVIKGYLSYNKVIVEPAESKLQQIEAEITRREGLDKELEKSLVKETAAKKLRNELIKEKFGK